MSESIYSPEERLGLSLMGWEDLTDEQRETIGKMSRVMGIDIVTMFMKIRYMGERVLNPRFVFTSMSDGTEGIKLRKDYQLPQRKSDP